VPHITVAEVVDQLAPLHWTTASYLTSSSPCQNHLSPIIVTCNFVASRKVSRTPAVKGNRCATSLVAFPMLSRPLDPSAFKSHVLYHHAIATAPKEIRGAIRAAAVCVRSRDQVRKILMNRRGTKIVCKATSGYLLETHQQKVYFDSISPYPEAN
jgi:hypothetical protein